MLPPGNRAASKTELLTWRFPLRRNLHPTFLWLRSCIRIATKETSSEWEWTRNLKQILQWPPRNSNRIVFLETDHNRNSKHFLHLENAKRHFETAQFEGNGVKVYTFWIQWGQLCCHLIMALLVRPNSWLLVSIATERTYFLCVGTSPRSTSALVRS